MKIWETKRNYKGISEFQIPMSLQPNVVDHWYCKLWILLDQIINLSFIRVYQSFTKLGCKDIGIRTFEFVAKT